MQKQFTNATILQPAYVGQKNDHLVVAQPYLQKQLLSNGTVIPSPYLSGNPALQSDLYTTNGQISGTEANGNQDTMLAGDLAAALVARIIGPNRLHMV